MRNDRGKQAGFAQLAREFTGAILRWVGNELVKGPGRMVEQEEFALVVFAKTDDPYRCVRQFAMVNYFSIDVAESPDFPGIEITIEMCAAQTG